MTAPTAFLILQTQSRAGTWLTDETAIAETFDANSNILGEVPPAHITDALDAAGIAYFDADDADREAREAAAWERQLQSLRPSHSTHL